MEWRVVDDPHLCNGVRSWGKYSSTPSRHSRLSLPVSGSRLKSPAIQSEHSHRYFKTSSAETRTFLDIASGEGYDSPCSHDPHSVKGVDVNPEAVEHARKASRWPKLSCRQRDFHPQWITQALMSLFTFETIEHFDDHELFMNEVRRVLRSDGILIISTPDRDLYTPPNAPSNIYHVHELTKAEFKNLLTRYFANVHMYYQRAILGSSLLLDSNDSSGIGSIAFEKRGSELFEKSVGMPRAAYMVAIASDGPIELPACTLYFETGEPYGHMFAIEAAFRAEEGRFREAEAAFRAEEGRFREAEAAFRAGEGRFREAEAAFRAEEARLLAELGKRVEDMSRQNVAIGGGQRPR